MANLRKSYKDKKRNANLSINNNVLDVMQEYCSVNHVSRSEVVEKLIVKFLEKEGLKI